MRNLHDQGTKGQDQPLKLVLPILLHGALAAVLSAMLTWCPEMLVDWSGGIRGWWPEVTKLWWSVLVIPIWHVGHPAVTAFWIHACGLGIASVSVASVCCDGSPPMVFGRYADIGVLVLLTVIAMYAPVHQIRRLNPSLTVPTPWDARTNRGQDSCHEKGTNGPNQSSQTIGAKAAPQSER